MVYWISQFQCILAATAQNVQSIRNFIYFHIAEHPPQPDRKASLCMCYVSPQMPISFMAFLKKLQPEGHHDVLSSEMDSSWHSGQDLRLDLLLPCLRQLHSIPWRHSHDLVLFIAVCLQCLPHQSWQCCTWDSLKNSKNIGYLADNPALLKHPHLSSPTIALQDTNSFGGSCSLTVCLSLLALLRFMLRHLRRMTFT